MGDLSDSLKDLGSLKILSLVIPCTSASDEGICLIAKGLKRLASLDELKLSFHL